MRVSEAQRLGAAAVLVIAMAVYGASLLRLRYPVREMPLPWGSQRPELMAVQIEADRGREGIYFLPDGMTVEKILGLVGIPGTNHREKAGLVKISTGSSLSISPQGEVSIGEMAVARKLALNLPIDLNRISEEDLCLIPGIGEKMAYKIIQLREEMGGFRDVTDLMVLPGIKGKKLNSLKGYLVVGTSRGEI